MSLRQFLSTRTLVRTLSSLRNSVVYSWSEVAERLGLAEDLYENPLHRELARCCRRRSKTRWKAT